MPDSVPRSTLWNKSQRMGYDLKKNQRNPNLQDLNTEEGAQPGLLPQESPTLPLKLNSNGPIFCPCHTGARGVNPSASQVLQASTNRPVVHRSICLRASPRHQQRREPALPPSNWWCGGKLTPTLQWNQNSSVEYSQGSTPTLVLSVWPVLLCRRNTGGRAGMAKCNVQWACDNI